MNAPRVFRWLTFFFALLIIFIILANDLEWAPGLFGPVYDFPNGDKIAHFLLMGTLAMLISLGFSNDRWRVLGIPLLKGSLILAFIITLEEFSQIPLDNRNFSLRDLAANYAGIFLLGELGAALRRLMTPQTHKAK